MDFERDPFLRGVRLERDLLEGREGYPFSIPAVQKLGTLEFAPGVTFLVGENGSGKSTLIEAIAILMGMNPEGGSQNFSFSMRASESCLHEVLRPIRGIRRPKRRFFLRAESLFNVATVAEDFAQYGWEKLHERSHGEAFLWLLNERFVEGGLYILDEPEAALSPARQLAMMVRMADLCAAGSQLIIATHSPILLSYPGALTYWLSDDGIEAVDAEDTDHINLTRDFLNNPEMFLPHLFSSDFE